MMLNSHDALAERCITLKSATDNPFIPSDLFNTLTLNRSRKPSVAENLLFHPQKRPSEESSVKANGRQLSHMSSKHSRVDSVKSRKSDSEKEKDTNLPDIQKNHEESDIPEEDEEYNDHYPEDLDANNSDTFEEELNEQKQAIKHHTNSNPNPNYNSISASEENGSLKKYKEEFEDVLSFAKNMEYMVKQSLDEDYIVSGLTVLFNELQVTDNPYSIEYGKLVNK